MAALMDTLAEHYEHLLGALPVLCAVGLLYELIRGTYYTNQPHAKLAIVAVLLLVQIVNLFLNLRATPRKALNLTMMVIGVDSIVGLLFMHYQ